MYEPSVNIKKDTSTTPKDLYLLNLRPTGSLIFFLWVLASKILKLSSIVLLEADLKWRKKLWKDKAGKM